VVEGVCVTLDPDFDFISVATDYLQEEGYYEETAKQLLSEGGRQIQDTTRALFEVPPKLNRTLDRVESGNLRVNVRLEDDNDVLDRLARRIVYGLFVAVGALSTAILFAFEGTSVLPAAVAAALSIPPLIALYRSFRRKRGIKAKPQFTRQSMRERRDRE
jgi:predicted unusual protein kinase regulating ubiquinone biosynthesis (AarF/ABC1/UbiB family)